MTERAAGSATGPRRWIPLVLALLFIGPLLAAMLLYYGLGGWRPQGGVNHGELILPPRPLPPLAVLSSVAGDGAEAVLLEGRWTLLMVGTGGCGEACRTALHDTRQVRLALGRRATRVQRVYLTIEGPQDPGIPAREHEDLVLLPLDGPEVETLLAALADGGLVEGSHEGYSFVVDPLGNLILRYSPGSDSKGMLEDLERLLRLSRIG